MGKMRLSFINSDLLCRGAVSGRLDCSDMCLVSVKRHEHHVTWKTCLTPVWVNKIYRKLDKK